MNDTLIIGDVHGKVDKYWKLLQQNLRSRSIQVGDFGFEAQHLWHLANVDSDKHKINFGNHDDYTFLHERHSLGNWSWDIERDLMTVRGAFSIDRVHRTENISWWANEEMNYEEMQQAVDAFILYKPSIVVTHDCPHEVSKHLFGGNIKNQIKTTTGNGLQVMFESHQPDLWIFGHHHREEDEMIDGTRFICLEELGTFKI